MCGAKEDFSSFLYVEGGAFFFNSRIVNFDKGIFGGFMFK